VNLESGHIQRLGSQDEGEIVEVVRVIGIHGTRSINDLSVGQVFIHAGCRYMKVGGCLGVLAVEVNGSNFLWDRHYCPQSIPNGAITAHVQDVVIPIDLAAETVTIKDPG